MEKVNALLLGLMVLLAFGCGGDEPEPKTGQNPEPIENLCLLMQDSSTNGGNTNRYYYDLEGKVIRIERKNYSQGQFYETLEYDNLGKLTQNNTFSQDSVLASYLTYQYNAAGRISRITGFRKNTSTTPFQETGYQRLVYNAQGKLIERGLFSTPQSTFPSSKYEYIHHSSSFIEVKYFSDPSSSGNLQLQGISEYRYDARKNPYATIPNAINMNIFTEHNLISVTEFTPTKQSLGNTVTISYQYNAEGYPIKYTQNSYGQVFEFYNMYNCQ